MASSLPFWECSQVISWLLKKWPALLNQLFAIFVSLSPPTPLFNDQSTAGCYARQPAHCQELGPSHFPPKLQGSFLDLIGQKEESPNGCLGVIATHGWFFPPLNRCKSHESSPLDFFWHFATHCFKAKLFCEKSNLSCCQKAFRKLFDISIFFKSVI